LPSTRRPYLPARCQPIPNQCRTSWRTSKRASCIPSTTIITLTPFSFRTAVSPKQDVRGFVVATKPQPCVSPALCQCHADLPEWAEYKDEFECPGELAGEEYPESSGMLTTFHSHHSLLIMRPQIVLQSLSSPPIPSSPSPFCPQRCLGSNCHPQLPLPSQPKTATAPPLNSRLSFLFLGPILSSQEERKRVQSHHTGWVLGWSGSLGGA